MEPLFPNQVRQIAKLAHLTLSESEVNTLQKELSAILRHMEALAAVETDGVTPMAHAVPMELRLRPDTVVPSLPIEVIAEQAPDWQDEHFRVPHIISGQDE